MLSNITVLSRLNHIWFSAALLHMRYCLKGQFTKKRTVSHHLLTLMLLQSCILSFIYKRQKNIFCNIIHPKNVHVPLNHIRVWKYKTANKWWRNFWVLSNTKRCNSANVDTVTRVLEELKLVFKWGLAQSWSWICWKLLNIFISKKFIVPTFALAADALISLESDCFNSHCISYLHL